MRWYVKALVQKAIGIVPLGYRVNYFFQKNITKRVILNDWFFDDILFHYLHFKKILAENTSIKNFEEQKFVELGTGWQPILPLLFSLENAAEITTLDLHNHTKTDNLLRLISFFEKRKLENYFQKNYIFFHEKRWNDLMKIKTELQKTNSLSAKKLNKIFEPLKIKFVHGDAAKINFEDKKFDVCFSVNTLEHIYQPALQAILKNLSDATKTAGWHLHVIDMNDHFSHIDHSISKYNYLKFSAAQWKLIDNNLQPQNRLRISDFEKIFTEINLKVAKEDAVEIDWEQFNQIILHPDFKKYNAERCAIPNAALLLQKL